MAQLIDGAQRAAALRLEARATALHLHETYGIRPGLAVVLVGDDPASAVYVGNKIRASAECGIRSFLHKLPADTPESDVLDLIARLNADPHVHGILVQLPLPAHIDPHQVIDLIDPDKDVDGFHPLNVGRLTIGRPGFIPCTPRGAQMLIDAIAPDLSGRHALVIGRSTIVGKPMAHLLLSRNATVTIAHSRTRDLPDLCRSADVLVAAVGKPHMVKGDWIKPGAIVIDVGINRIEKDGRRQLVGDVDFAAASEIAGWITPVPGGVGPMTIACLMLNTLDAARQSVAWSL